MVLKQSKQGAAESLGLEKAMGRCLFEDIQSPHDHPFFDQSAVDGYALRFEDIGKHHHFQIAGHVRAGSGQTPTLQSGISARIFTGAPLPDGADTVVMQEHVESDGKTVTLQKIPDRKGTNVRYRGEQIRAGQVAATAGSFINPALIGHLATLGIDRVRVHSLPSVVVLSTGDEFANNADDFTHGKIFESNGIMLKAALAAMGIKAETHRIPESKEVLLEFMQGCKADLIISTGGVSVGEHDYTRSAFEEAGFLTIFHQVKQKPGKPMLFSQRERQTAFGLPGNPRAAMMGFYIYILPWIQHFMGSPKPGLKRSQIPLAHSYNRKPDGKVHFVSAQCRDGLAYIDGNQNSHMLGSLSTATHILVIPGEGVTFEVGLRLEAFELP